VVVLVVMMLVVVVLITLVVVVAIVIVVVLVLRTNRSDRALIAPPVVVRMSIRIRGRTEHREEENQETCEEEHAP
jgi:hypothetical protein